MGESRLKKKNSKKKTEDTLYDTADRDARYMLQDRIDAA